MKRILLISAIIMSSFILFSFTETPTEANYKFVENTISKIALEAASFQEWEDNHYTSDKQVYFKRIRYWDAFGASADIDRMEEILSRN